MLFFQHEGVRRGHHHICIGMFYADFPARIGDAGGGVARFGFGEDLIDRNPGQLLPHLLHVPFARHHPEVVQGAHRQEAFYRQLNQCLTYAQHIDELLGCLRNADGPEAASHPTGHDYDMGLHPENFCKYSEKSVYCTKN